jgi:hypothetical protein
MDSHRWVCRTRVLQFTGTSSEDEPTLPAHQLRDLNEIAAGVVQHGDLGAGHVVEMDILADPERLTRLNLSAIEG